LSGGIWQAAKWWHEFYESKAALTEAPLAGHHDTGQSSAAVVEAEPPPALPKKRLAKRT